MAIDERLFAVDGLCVIDLLVVVQSLYGCVQVAWQCVYWVSAVLLLIAIIFLILIPTFTFTCVIYLNFLLAR